MEKDNIINILRKYGNSDALDNIALEILIDPNVNIGNEERESLFSFIKKKKFLIHENNWHLDLMEGWNLFFNKINKFYEVNKECKFCADFLEDNLFLNLEKECSLFFNKERVVIEYYSKVREEMVSIDCKFLSPLKFKELFIEKGLFVDILPLITNKLIDMEERLAFTENPIIKEGVKIMDSALNDPSRFVNFVNFWNKYKKVLLSSNDIEEDLMFLYKNDSMKLKEYKEHIKTMGQNPTEKTILAKRVAEFFFKHTENYMEYNGQIPNALVWLNESKDFLKIQNYLDNMSEIHLKYFSNFQKSSNYFNNITKIVFADNLGHKTISSRFDYLMNKNFDLSLLFEELDKPKHKVGNRDGEDVLENYLLWLEKKVKIDGFVKKYNFNKLKLLIGDKVEGKKYKTKV